MDIFVYSDESGVFDKVHNDIYVFGGLILLGKQSKDEWARRYIAAEKAIRYRYSESRELKASAIDNRDKGKLIRSLNRCYKFGVVIQQARVLDRIFSSKKDKQRYLDYAYKIGLKRALEDLIKRGIISDYDVDCIHVYVDEHTTATNGRYELREGLEQELKNGTYNYNYGTFYEPLFPQLKGIDLHFCNSATTTLIRAADQIANNIYHRSLQTIPSSNDMQYIHILP